MTTSRTAYTKRKKKRMEKCPSGKMSYRDEIAAKLALATLKHKDVTYLRDGRNLNVRRAYKCDRCPNWHLTSQKN